MLKRIIKIMSIIVLILATCIAIFAGYYGIHFFHASKKTELNSAQESVLSESTNGSEGEYHRALARLPGKYNPIYYFQDPDRILGAMVHYGIDVSKWNGEIDWEKAAENGVEFAIIHIGSTGTTDEFSVIEDSSFSQNIEGATCAGIQVGVYYYSQAMTGEEGAREASFVIEALEPYRKRITLPVFFDMEKDSEDSRIFELTQADATTAANGFLDTIREAGYQVGIYSSAGIYKDQFQIAELNSDSTWIAQYSTINDYEGEYAFWQYSKRGKVEGIDGYVDLNFWYDISDKTHTTE